MSLDVRISRLARRGVARVLLAGFILVAGVVQGSPGVASDPTMNGWSGARLVLPQGGQLDDVSCGSRAFCVASDDSGNVFVDSSGTWQPLRNVLPRRNPTSVSCVGESFCLVLAHLGAYATFDGSGWMRPSFIEQGPASGWEDVSCVSASFCVAVDKVGTASVFDGDTWSTPALADQVGGLTAVSCVSSTSCTAVDDSGHVIAFNGSRWGAPERIDGSVRLTDISCLASDTRCIAVDANGNALSYDGSTWTVTRVDQRPLLGVTCLVAGLCIAIEASDAFVYSAGTWTDQGLDGSFAGITCNDADCIVVGGLVEQTYINGGFDAGTQVEPFASGASGISCSKPTYCVATDFDGNAVVGHGHSWSQPAAIFPDGHYIQGIDCTSGNVCAAVSLHDQAAFLLDGIWSAPMSIPGDIGPTGISCTSASFCMVAGGSGDAATWDGSTWRVLEPPQSRSLNAVSCTSPTFCAVVGYVTAYTWNGSTWSRTKLDPASNLTSVSCRSDTFCMASDDHGRAFEYDGAEWSGAVPVMDKPHWTNVSCAARTSCVMSGRTTRVTSRFDGSSWSPAVTIDIPVRGGLYGLSCPSIGSCEALDGRGYVLTTHPTKGAGPRAIPALPPISG